MRCVSNRASILKRQVVREDYRYVESVLLESPNYISNL